MRVQYISKMHVHVDLSTCIYSLVIIVFQFIPHFPYPPDSLAHKNTRNMYFVNVISSRPIMFVTTGTVQKLELDEAI